MLDEPQTPYFTNASDAWRSPDPLVGCALGDQTLFTTFRAAEEPAEHHYTVPVKRPVPVAATPALGGGGDSGYLSMDSLYADMTKQHDYFKRMEDELNERLRQRRSTVDAAPPAAGVPLPPSQRILQPPQSSPPPPPPSLQGSPAAHDADRTERGLSPPPIVFARPGNEDEEVRYNSSIDSVRGLVDMYEKNNKSSSTTASATAAAAPIAELGTASLQHPSPQYSVPRRAVRCVGEQQPLPPHVTRVTVAGGPYDFASSSAPAAQRQRPTQQTLLLPDTAGRCSCLYCGPSCPGASRYSPPPSSSSSGGESGARPTRERSDTVESSLAVMSEKIGLLMDRIDRQTRRLDSLQISMDSRPQQQRVRREEGGDRADDGCRRKSAVSGRKKDAGPATAEKRRWKLTSCVR